MKIAENLEWRVNKIVTSKPCTWVSYSQSYMIPQLYHPITPWFMSLWH